MDDTTKKRLRGLKDLVRDAVEHGASAIERVHLATAERPFKVLERVPGVELPARAVHQVHDAVVAGSYGGVRAVTRAASRALDVALDVLDAVDEHARAEGEPAHDEPAPRPGDDEDKGAG